MPWVKTTWTKMALLMAVAALTAAVAACGGDADPAPSPKPRSAAAPTSWISVKPLETPTGDPAATADGDIEDAAATAGADSEGNGGDAVEGGSGSSAAGDPRATPAPDPSDIVIAPAPPLASILARAEQAADDERIVHQKTETVMRMSMSAANRPSMSMNMRVSAEHWFQGADLARVEHAPMKLDVDSSDPFTGGLMGGLVQGMGSTLEVSLMIRNGDTVWMVMPGLNTYSKSSAADFGDVPLSADRAPELMHDLRGRLASRFDLEPVGVTEVRGARANLVRATPKATANVDPTQWHTLVESLDLWFDADSGRLVQFRMTWRPDMFSHLPNTRGATATPRPNAATGASMRMTFTTTVVSTDHPASVPDDWFTFTPPPGAREMPPWKDIFGEGASGDGGAFGSALDPIPDVSTLAEARDYLGFPVLAADPVPAGCMLDAVDVNRLWSDTVEPDAYLELKYECPDPDFGHVTIRQTPAGVVADLVVDMREEMLKINGRPQRQVAIGDHTATLYESDFAPILIWDTATTHVDVHGLGMTTEKVIEVARSLR